MVDRLSTNQSYFKFRYMESGHNLTFFTKLKPSNFWLLKFVNFSKFSTHSYFIFLSEFFRNFQLFSKITFGFGFYHLRALFFILFIDACLTDDEPL